MPDPGPVPTLTTSAWVTRGVYAISFVVVAIVAALMLTPPREPPRGLPIASMPGFHALLNGTVAVLLLLGRTAIGTGRRAAHRACMVAAFTLSATFLVSYVVYHSFAPGAQYGGEGWIRIVYFAVLLTHIPLAALILPLVLFTLLRALAGDFGGHRRVARWTFPLWLYVAVTGVVVFLMMRPWYGAVPGG